jgi:transposase
MSLHPQHPIPPVPEQTARIARAAFPKGSPYLTLRDTLGTIFEDGHFADLYPKQGQPACPPWRLALITLMQFREGLSDRQAAEAVRARIDWKDLLGLELSDPGFDFSVLCEFRDRLLAGGAQERLLERVLEVARELGVLKARGRQRTDSTHVLAAVRTLNRLELVAETLRAALNGPRPLLRIGCAPLPPRLGTSAMAAGSRTRGCRRARRNGKLTPAKSERTAFASWKSWRHLMRPNSSPTSRRSRFYGRYGRGTLSPVQRAAAGPPESLAHGFARSASLVAARIASSRPTMWRRAFAPSAR